jgi:hypothetical protein
MTRPFFTRHPDTNQPILLIKGVLGFEILAGWDDGTIKAANALNNNTPEDIKIALACSMFGWDIPKASDLSPKPKTSLASE